MLRIEGLCSGYGRINVLKEVELEVGEGEIVSLIGSNGAGKTTLLRAISGVQPVTAGEITFRDMPITRMSARKRVELGISQVPEGRQVFGQLTVDDNLRLGAYLRRDAEVALDMDQVLSLFPVLAEKRHVDAGLLSGGQQQMLAVGRAMMARPALILLDEPSLGLAPLIMEQIFSSIRALRKDGTTVLLIDQNAHAALAISDRAYVLELGAISLKGQSKDLLKDPRILDLYLGSDLEAEPSISKGL